MTSITAPMQALSMSPAPAPMPTPPHKPPAETQKKHTKIRGSSRPDQVDPRPVPPTDEWLEVRAAGGRFYADDDAMQKMLINLFPRRLGHRDPANVALLYPALLYLRDYFKRPDISMHVALLPQRAKNLNPQIEDEVGDHVLILGLFPLEEEAYLDRMTQKEVDELAGMMGTKPTWWKISVLMDDDE